MKGRHKKRNINKKIGLAMLALGTITVLFLFLPLKYWVVLLCITLVVFGIMLIKK